MSSKPISRAWLLIAERCGEVHGTPIPKRICTLGTKGQGWHVRLNPTDVCQDGIEPFCANVYWGEWIAGILYPYGGIIAAGAGANEDNLIAWLECLAMKPTENNQ